jgi:hypothetical protein
VHNLYRYVGDKDEISSLLPAVEGVVRWFDAYCDDTGLPTNVGGWVLIDWASVYSDGASATLCGLYARALLEYAEIARWAGDAGRAEWAEDRHGRLRLGFEQLWDPESGRYADTLVDGRRGRTASQHGQAAALVGGLAPRERWDRLVHVLTDETALVHSSFSRGDGPSEPGSETGVGTYIGAPPPPPWWDVDSQVVRAQPFFRYVVHDALAIAGRSGLIAHLCLDWCVALERSATSWTETWYGGTVSHGWSSTPTRDLIVYVLGISPAAPGFGTARIEPALGHLDWARGAAPTPYGLIEVHATRDWLEVRSPVPFETSGERYRAGHHRIPLG